MILKMLLFVGVVTLAFALGAMVGWSNASKSEAPPPISTTDSEVSDLIARLAPLSKEPDGEGYSSGLDITFRGRRQVSIDLKTPDGNEYHGRATNLQDAAKRIAEPSLRIKEALQGWGK